MIVSLLLLISLWVQLVRSPSPLFICPVPCALWKLVCLFVCFSISVVIPLCQGRMSAAHVDLDVHFWNVCREAFHCISSKLLRLLMLLLNHCALQSFFPRFFFFLSVFSFFLSFKSWLLDWSHFPLVAWLAVNLGSLFCCRSDVLQASPSGLRMKNLTVPGAGCSCCSWAFVDVYSVFKSMFQLPRWDPPRPHLLLFVLFRCVLTYFILIRSLFFSFFFLSFFYSSDCGVLQPKDKWMDVCCQNEWATLRPRGDGVRRLHVYFR